MGIDRCTQFGTDACDLIKKYLASGFKSRLNPLHFEVCFNFVSPGGFPMSQCSEHCTVNLVAWNPEHARFVGFVPLFSRPWAIRLRCDEYRLDSIYPTVSCHMDHFLNRKTPLRHNLVYLVLKAIA